MSRKRARSLVSIAASVLGVAVVILGSVGCGNEADKPDPTEQPHSFQIEVEVTDTDGKVVPEAPVELDGKTIGYTDKEGQFQASLREKPGTKIELAIGDVEGYRIVDTQSVTEKLELKRNLSGQGFKGVPVLLHAVAESVQRRYLVWVDATCEDSLPADACQGLLVRRGGEVVATTDRLGKAHFNLREQPEETISVTIDTPESGEEDDAPTFEPGDPTYEMALGIEPTIYRLEPTFKDPSEESDDQDSRRVYRRQNTRSTSGSSDSSGSSGSSDGSDSGSSGSSGGSDSAEPSSGGGGGGGGGSSDDNKDGDDSIELF